MSGMVKRLRTLSTGMVRQDPDIALPQGFIDPAVAADEIQRLANKVKNLEDGLRKIALPPPQRADGQQCDHRHGEYCA